MLRTCKSCCFFELCGARVVCEYYATIDDKMEEPDLLNQDDQLRFEYLLDWLDYVEEWD